MDYSELFLGEDNFIEKMDGEFSAFRREHYREGYCKNSQGKSLHYTYLEHPYARGIIVICHGFCEFVRKYDEAIYYFYQLGYSIYFLDHMGHGFSYRLVEEYDKVHAKDFSVYIEDFHAFVEEVVAKRQGGLPLLLFAHSMGGAIGAGFLERYPKYFRAAVLSSPMLAMSAGKAPEWVILLLADVARMFGRDTKFVPSMHGFDNIYDFSGSSMLSEQRYSYVFRLRQETPQYQTYGATYGWTAASVRGLRRIRREAKKVEIPVLLMQAGKDHMVLPEAQEEFARKTKNTQVVRFAESKHEIFNAQEKDRNLFFTKIFEFFKEYSR
ncbi:MAG: alpha/beta hydrolase [Lachnospiraceae bacterium]|nr:alpha/beta hydrolase [Lachnospiraceae bacterium]